MSRIYKYISAICGFIICTDVNAQDVKSEMKIEDIEKCLRSNPDFVQSLSCIGKQSSKCMDSPDGSTTIGMRLCYSNESILWSKLLDKYYGEANAIFEKSGNNYLVNIQSKWIDYKNASCEWTGEVYPEGSFRGTLSTQCVMNQTAVRAIELIDIRDRLLER